MYEMMIVINVRSLWNLLVNIHIIIKHIAQDVHYPSSSMVKDNFLPTRARLNVFHYSCVDAIMLIH